MGTVIPSWVGFSIVFAAIVLCILGPILLLRPRNKSFSVSEKCPNTPTVQESGASRPKVVELHFVNPSGTLEFSFADGTRKSLQLQTYDVAATQVAMADPTLLMAALLLEQYERQRGELPVLK